MNKITNEASRSLHKKETLKGKLKRCLILSKCFIYDVNIKTSENNGNSFFMCNNLI